MSRDGEVTWGRGGHSRSPETVSLFFSVPTTVCQPSHLVTAQTGRQPRELSQNATMRTGVVCVAYTVGVVPLV